jgi:ParB-like chromosome segregation protein Spo0J
MQFTQIAERPIASLRPYPGNARTHSKKQLKQIAASISRFGFTNPVLVSDGGEIVAGHGRVEAAKSLGWKTVPVILPMPFATALAAARSYSTALGDLAAR